MKQEQFNIASDKIKELQTIQRDLAVIKEILDDKDSKSVRVKINTRWIIDMPKSALKKIAEDRKAELEVLKTKVEQELDKI